MQKELKCPICRGETGFVLKVADRDVYSCGNCQAQFAHPMREYHGGYVANDLYDPNYGWLTFDRQSRIIRSIIPAGRILDYGCGGGHFLSHMNGVRWFRYGIEASDDARAVAITKRIRVFKSIIEADLRDNFFDVVTMFAVIEHLANPKETVEELYRVLKPSGLLVVMTGDVTSQKALRVSDKWHMYISPEHHFFFSAKALDLMMANLGYEKIKSFHTDGGMLKVPYLDKIPIVNKLPLFDHYYGYYRKGKQ